MKPLSRNLPTAYVVGAAGFIGSHLTDKLLELGVQVVGLDNLSTGRLSNLAEASKSKHFHFINQSAASFLGLDLPRLDYAVFCLPYDLPSAEYRESLNSFLKLILKFKPKVLYISSLDLYEGNSAPNNLVSAERLISERAIQEKINVRVLRLSGVFGPRMNFAWPDPMVSLLEAEVLSKHTAYSPEVLTRSMFIEDAINLLTKALMHGGTAHKLYDGGSINAYKLADLKEALKNLSFYEGKDFQLETVNLKPTPNLIKTCKELSWKPKAQIIRSLKQTVEYFKLHPVVVTPKMSVKTERIEVVTQPKEERLLPESQKIVKQGSLLKKNFVFKKKDLQILLAVVIIGYLVFYPLLSLVIGSLLIKGDLHQSQLALRSGDLVLAKKRVESADKTAESLDKMLSSWVILQFLTKLDPQLNLPQQITQDLGLLTKGAKFSIEGAEQYSAAFEIISGSKEGEISTTFNLAYSALDQAETNFSELELHQSMYPRLLRAQLYYYPGLVELIAKIKILSLLIPEALRGERHYLVVEWNEEVARSVGGKITSVANLSFKDGRLVKIEVQKIEDLTKNSPQVLPPSDLRADLKVGNWDLGTANWEGSFDEVSERIRYFYQLETGVKTDGVVALDSQTLAQISGVIGSKSSLEDILKGLFLVNKQNWLGVAEILNNRSISKHIQAKTTSSRVNSYLKSLGLRGGIDLVNLVYLSEINLSSAPSTSIKRSWKMETVFGQQKEVKHLLSVHYSNQDQVSQYQAKIRLYLDPKTIITNLSWGGERITDLTNFSDYSLSGYSFKLDLVKNEQKDLVVEWSDQNKIEGESYQLSLVKQPGTQEDSIEIKFNYPPNWRIKDNPNLQGLFDKDLLFKLEFKPL